MTTWEKNNGYPEKLKALKERLKAVPQLPGVYLFKNLNGDVIYVGKARILRSRLRSYFQTRRNWSPRCGL